MHALEEVLPAWDQARVALQCLDEFWRQVIAISLMMCVALAGTVIISFANYGMGPVMASANSLASRVGLQVVFTLLIILGNIFIFILTPIVAHRYERHYTFGGKELSCFSKMVSFQVFNTVVASTVFYFFSSFFEPTRHSWYEYGSSMVLNVLIGDIFVINLGIDFGQPGQLITKYLQAPTARTQRELNTMVTSSRTADIYLAFRLQLVVKIVVICLIYSSAIPICYLLTAFFRLLAMWIDRYNLLRRLAPPPRSPDALVSLVLGKIFPAAIAIHHDWSFWGSRTRRGGGTAGAEAASANKERFVRPSTARRRSIGAAVRADCTKTSAS